MNKSKADSTAHSLHRSSSAHSIPLTSSWETLWFAASPRTAARAAQPPAGQRSPGRLFLNLCKCDSAPWLRQHTSRKNHKENPQRRLHTFTIYARDVCLLAIARSGVSALFWGELLQFLVQCAAAQSSLRTGSCMQAVHGAAAEGWAHSTAAGAGGQCRDNLMKTKRPLSIKPRCSSVKAESDG